MFENGFEYLLSIGAADDVFTAAFRMGHHTHHVAFPVGDPGNGPQRSVRVGLRDDLPVFIAVPEQNLIGKICLHIPYWGYFAEFLKTPFGFVFSLVVPGIVIFMMYLVSVWRTLAVQKKQEVVI